MKTLTLSPMLDTQLGSYKIVRVETVARYLTIYLRVPDQGVTTDHLAVGRGPVDKEVGTSEVEATTARYNFSSAIHQVDRDFDTDLRWHPTII